MEPETVAETTTRDATDFADAVAVRTEGADPEREYDYERLRTDARKTGNALSHRGVREGETLAVVADPPGPEAALALLAGALLGAVVRFAPPREVEARAILAPTDRVAAFDLPAGGQRVAYGPAPEDPSVAHFEEEMWSENPAFPPPTAGPDDPLLWTPGGPLSHGAVLAGAREVVEEYGLDGDDDVALRSSLARPGAAVAGLVAPLLVGATVLFPRSPDAAGTVAVVHGNRYVPEERAIDPGDVTVG